MNHVVLNQKFYMTSALLFRYYMRKYNENHIEFSILFIRSARETCAAVHTCSLPCIKRNHAIHPRGAHTLLEFTLTF